MQTEQLFIIDTMIQWIALFFALAVLLSVGTSCASKSKDANNGLTDNKLRPCPPSPNCVCSEYSGAASTILPISIKDNHRKAWSDSISIIQEMGGKIIEDRNDYLHATFTSRIFRFVDDFELRLDAAQGVIHIRSASRIGYSDLGVNRKRAEKFKSLFASTTDNPDVHPGN